jgi:hypothetical protein
VLVDEVDGAEGETLVEVDGLVELGVLELVETLVEVDEDVCEVDGLVLVELGVVEVEVVVLLLVLVDGLVELGGLELVELGFGEVEVFGLLLILGFWDTVIWLPFSDDFSGVFSEVLSILS